MNFSKLSSNEKTAAIAAVVLVLGGIISNWGGLMWLSVLCGIAVLVVIFLPQLSAGTKLPGSEGSLLVGLGVVAAAGAVIEVLRFLNYFFNTFDDYRTWLFAAALVAALVMAYAGWMIFQGEGGKFNLGMSGSAGGSAAAPPPPAPPAAPPAPPSEPMSPPSGGMGMGDGNGEGDSTS
jgi:hypothetical protein